LCLTPICLLFWLETTNSRHRELKNENPEEPSQKHSEKNIEKGTKKSAELLIASVGAYAEKGWATKTAVVQKATQRTP
jgi:hypothetical protein